MTKKLTDRELAALLRQNLSAFIEKCFYELKPGTEFLPHWVVDLIASKLEACQRGEIRRLIINLPPRSLKSIAVSVAFPAFLLGHNPTAEIICASYAQDLSDKFSRDTRTIMTSAWYKNTFPTRLAANRQAVNEFETTVHGFRKATSVGGVLTGRGAEFILIDDPLKPDEAMSKVQRENINDWFSHTLFSRLNDKEAGCIIVVMQRLHENDLTGHLLAQQGWELLSLPAIAQEDEAHVIKSAFGNERIIRKAGDAIHPEHESRETLDVIRQSVGTYVFAAQYLQAPTPPGGLMVKPEWFKRYKASELPARFDQIVMSCDTANKVSELSDYSVFTIWGVKGKLFYLIHVLRRKMGYPELKRTIVETARQFAATTVLIEDRASGTQLIQDLIAEGVHCVKGCAPEGDKVMRFHAQTATIENGFVLLPEAAHWLDNYLHEITSFPNSKHDDQVDSTAQALAWMKIPNSADGWIRFYRELVEEQNGTRRIRLLVPPGISHVHTWSGEQMSVPNDRIITVTEKDAGPLIAAKFTKVD